MLRQLKAYVVNLSIGSNIANKIAELPGLVNEVLGPSHKFEVDVCRWQNCAESNYMNILNTFKQPLT